MKSRFSLFTLTLAALTVAGNATANTIQSADLTAWKTTIVTGSAHDTDFGPVSPTAVSSYTLFMDNGTPFTWASGDGSVSLKEYDNLSNPIGSGNLKGVQGASGTTKGLKITTPVAGINALVLFFGTTGGSPVTITLSDGEVFTGSPAGNTGNALFLSISHPIYYLTVTSTTSAPVVNGFSFATSNLAQDTPTDTAVEAATSILMGGGLLVLIAAGRRFRPILTA
jgi:hypothetical protein